MPPPCDVLVLRHGESTANVGGELVGRRDPPLTEAGRRQAADAAAYLGCIDLAAGIAAVVSSPLLRARETAGIAAAALGVAVAVDDRLVEIDYGELEGRPFADLLPHWPPSWIEDASVPVPGGESVAAMAARVWDATWEHAAAAAARGGALLVVTHLGPTKCLVAAATGDLAGAQSRVHVGPASLTRLRFDVESTTATLVALNLTPPGPERDAATGSPQPSSSSSSSSSSQKSAGGSS